MVFALLASLVDNLIQAVNILGSLFYGCILGIFLVGFYVPYVKGKAVFVGAIVAELVVLFCFWKVDSIGYLWYNVIGCLLVIIVGLLAQPLIRQPKAAS
jgi:Na+/proline symporter